MSNISSKKCFDMWFERRQKYIDINENISKKNNVMFNDKLLYFIIKLKT